MNGENDFVIWKMSLFKDLGLYPDKAAWTGWNVS